MRSCSLFLQAFVVCDKQVIYSVLLFHAPSDVLNVGGEQSGNLFLVEVVVRDYQEEVAREAPRLVLQVCNFDEM